MPYTFELSFTGLCILAFSGPDRANPTQVNALLVNARHLGQPHNDHVPYLSFPAGNLVVSPTPPAILIPGPDGTQVALEPLSGQEVSLILPASVTPSLTASWRDRTVHPTLPLEPPTRADETWLDWAMALQRVNPETKDPDVSAPPLNGLKSVNGATSLISGKIQLTRGHLRAEDFPRRINQTTGAAEYVKWEFRVPPPPAGPVLATHAMAGRVVLSIPGIPETDPVILQSNQMIVALHARQLPDLSFESVVRASVTNLPSAEDPSPVPHLRHYAHFYDPVVFSSGPPPPPLRLPRRLGAPITSTTVFCPPSTHVKAI
jgi:hypothetical protein